MRIRVAGMIVVLTMTLSGASAAQAASSGINDYTCTPSAAHPQPLVLVHGLGARGADNWSYMAPKLRDAGYCVYYLTYGVDARTAAFPFYRPGGTRPMQESAQQLKGFVDGVLGATGAAQVSLVGHSEGTVMPRWYIERLGGAPKVKRFITLTPLWRGSNVGGVATLRDLGAASGVSSLIVNLVNGFCTACTQVIAGSSYLNDLNADGEVVPGIEFTNIVTKYDELVVPYTSGIMRDGGTNIVLQDVCPHDIAEHAAVAFDANVLQLFVNALDPANAKPVACAY